MILLLCIYDNNGMKGILREEWFHIKLDEAQVQYVGKKGRSSMRDVCKVSLGAVNQSPNNCPIIRVSLTFDIFSHYLTTTRKQNQSYLEKSTYRGIQSALRHLFRISDQQMSKTMEREMSQFMSWIQRTIVNEKIRKGGSLNEGKLPMSFQTYEKMCELLYFGWDDE